MCLSLDPFEMESSLKFVMSCLKHAIKGKNIEDIDRK